MSSILSSLDVAQRALYAQQLGLEIAQKNIANAHTPGYTRQRLNTVPEDLISGGGIGPVSIESFRNRFIDYRISQELQDQGERSSISWALRQVEALANDSGGLGLQGALSGFFNSLSSLANMPEDLSLRQQVVSSADSLASEFRRLYGRIQSVQSAVDRSVSDTVREINAIAGRIAVLNVRVAEAKAARSPDESNVRDERQQLVDKLSDLVDLSYFETETGAFTLTGKEGFPLVVENQSRTMEAVILPGGAMLRIAVDGTDVTPRIQSGKLGGLLRVRDTLIPGYLNTLDDMAAALIARINAQHAQGRDLNGAQGGDLFAPFTPIVSGSNAGAARAMSVALSDLRQIAAAGPGSGPGSNANAKLLAAIRHETLFASGTATAGEFYAKFLSGIGIDLQNAIDGLKTQENLLLQLQNQRDSFSGVNLDDEAVSIIKYQKAYQASARFVRVVDVLSEELIRLLGN